MRHWLLSLLCCLLVLPLWASQSPQPHLERQPQGPSPRPHHEAAPAQPAGEPADEESLLPVPKQASQITPNRFAPPPVDGPVTEDGSLAVPLLSFISGVMAYVSVALGIILLGFGILPGFLFALLAIILGAIGMGKKYKRHWIFSLLGIGLGALYILLIMGLFILVLIAFM